MQLLIKGEKDKHNSPFFDAFAVLLFYCLFLLTSFICLFSGSSLLIYWMEYSSILHLKFLGLLVSKDLGHHFTFLSSPMAKP